MPSPLPYFLGCPAWSISEWRGRFLPEGTPQWAFLNEYSKVFNSVEGNSFFYALPKREIVQRWAEQSAEGFQFCMKVPRDISHAPQLLSEGTRYDELIDRLQLLLEGNRLGPTFLQLHASFGPRRLEELKRFIENWPPALPLAVEVRHEEFFQNNAAEDELNSLLAERKIDRSIFDSRALFHAPPCDPIEEKSQGRKPRLPVKWHATGQRPFIRFVGRNEIERVDPWLKETAAVVSKWIHEGKQPYVFMHAPNDVLAPQLCRRFHRHLMHELPALSDLVFPAISSQLALFED
ncbi:MAG: DUF72 domain-containing protein [Verrucomicrobiota bacterium]